MKLIVLLLAGTLVGFHDNEPTDYTTAYKKAQTGDKPLLVFRAGVGPAFDWRTRYSAIHHVRKEKR